MRIFRTVHWVLAAILLVQSVVAVATITPVVPPSDSSQVESLKSEPMVSQDEIPCHGSVADIAIESTEDCCASMDEPCCEFGCAVPGVVALPVDTILPSGFHHPAFVAFSNNIHLYNLSAGLFRPPRSIQ